MANPPEAAQRTPAAGDCAAARPTAAPVRSDRGGPLPAAAWPPAAGERGGSRPWLATRAYAPRRPDAPVEGEPIALRASRGAQAVDHIFG